MDLKPCPFCGSSKIRVDSGVLSSHCAKCIPCEAEGPYVDSGDPEEIIKAWNNRQEASVT